MAYSITGSSRAPLRGSTLFIILKSNTASVWYVTLISFWDTLMNKLFTALTLITAGTVMFSSPLTAHAAGKQTPVSAPSASGPVTGPQTPQGTKTTVNGQPASSAQGADQSKDQGPQPGKPIHLVGPSFVMFGDTTFQLGTVDFQKKKVLSSVIMNPPWSPVGMSLCGADAIKDRDHNTCVTIDNTGVTTFPAPPTLPVFTKATLPKNVTDGSVAVCSDCTLTVKTGLFSSSSGTGFVVTSLSGHWHGPFGELEN